MSAMYMKKRKNTDGSSKNAKKPKKPIAEAVATHLQTDASYDNVKKELSVHSELGKSSNSAPETLEVQDNLVAAIVHVKTELVDAPDGFSGLAPRASTLQTSSMTFAVKTTPYGKRRQNSKDA